MNDERELVQRLAHLKAAFDGAFAAPAGSGRTALRGYLAIRLNDTPYALDLEEVASVRKGVAVTPLPSEEPLLLGVAGFGGALAAVFDLTGLLGLASGAEPGWLVLARDAPVAFAFHALEGQLQVSRDAGEAPLASDGGGSSDLEWRPGLPRPVIRLSGLLARLRGASTDRPTEGAGAR